MKNVKSILNHIFPKNSKLNEHRCFNKILSLFPKILKEHTLFCYKKDETLFFVIDHPGIKMEFNYNKNLINELLNIAKNSILECKDIKIKNYKVYVSNKFIQKSEQKEKKMNFFYEKSSGKFKIFSQNEDIKKIFENIKKEIKKLKDEDID